MFGIVEFFIALISHRSVASRGVFLIGSGPVRAGCGNGTSWISFDGATYGMTLSGKNVQLYQQAIQLAPENPRVIFSKAEWDMGSARYFGKDTTPYCKDVEKALELFATFKSEIPFYPKWGKERAERVLASCKG